MTWRVRSIVLSGLCLALAAMTPSFSAAQSAVTPGAPVAPPAPEDVYRGELVAFPGAWGFHIGKAGIILVSDDELVTLSEDPDRPLNLATSFSPREESLRQICERAQAAGLRTLIIAFDQFFAQYRPGLDKPRRLTPDMDEYITRIAAISHFAEQYGLGLELSLLSPLEIGPAYAKQTGESGVWMHYRKGLRDPKSGAFSVEFWRQRDWCANKGHVNIESMGVRVFAFREQGIQGSAYKAVKPEDIVEISEVAQTEEWPGLDSGMATRVRVFGAGKAEIGPLDRVLVVQLYRTPEMDYFSPNALAYLKGLIDKYAAAGVRLNALYADEMHIQQDWRYFSHHDHGEFALRYVSPGLARAFAERYGQEYVDFARWLVYFVHGQEDASANLDAKADTMLAFGDTPEAVRRTALFRSHYYAMLQDGVVDLFTSAKRHAEERMGKRLDARAHATWAESPTIDYWNVGHQPRARQQYEYTSNFVWSCTVHQAASACHDYFKWGDFLTGNGNDHTEGGWLDRDYYALALACSTGILNEVPYSYCAHWGMPGEISNRRTALVNTYGAAGSPLWGLVQDMQHRDVNVLMLYPLDLVSVDERFGSWMTQYGYANYITQAKLLERGAVNSGAIEVAGRRFTTLATLFEPFPQAQLLEMMRQLAEQGGRVVWAGPPPVIKADGSDALATWQDLFGVTYTPAVEEGLRVPGRLVEFEGPLAGVAPQTILTDLLIDRVYPIAPREGTAPIARVQAQCVGALRKTTGGGALAFLGYRPRDDQARSLGYETRNWIDVLDTLGAYPPTGAFADFNDNTERLSRTTDFLTCRFPNGTIAITRHFRDLEEDWGGGFARDEAADKAYLDAHPLAPVDLRLQDFRVAGHTVTFDGQSAVAFCLDAQGHLIAFAGNGAREITIDGRTTTYADQPVAQLAWAPVGEARRVPGGALLQAMVYGGGTIRIPEVGLPTNVEVVAEGGKPGSRGEVVASRRENGALVIDVAPGVAGRWLYVVPVQ